MTKAPWHLWTVGIVTLLWNAMGAFDYLMTETRNEAYLARFTPEMLEYYFSFPTWVIACWAIAVWGGVLGSILILLRRCWAAPVLLVSLLAMVANAIYNYGFGKGYEMSGIGGTLFTVAIFIVSLLLWLYARAMCGRKVLR